MFYLVVFQKWEATFFGGNMKAQTFIFHFNDTVKKKEIFSMLIEPMIRHLPYMSDINIYRYIEELILSLYMESTSDLYSVGDMRRISVSYKFKVKQLVKIKRLSGVNLWNEITDMYLSGVGLNNLHGFYEVKKTPATVRKRKRK